MQYKTLAKQGMQLGRVSKNYVVFEYAMSVVWFFLNWFVMSVVPFLRYGFGERYLSWISLYFGYAVVSTLPLLSGFSGIAILCSLAFVALSLYHRYEINDRNRRGVTWHSFSKGTSWLYEFDLSDIPLTLNDEVIHKWIEPALVGIAGGIAYLFAPAVGIWLLISAVALTVNAQIDYHYERSVFLDARDGQVEARYLGDALSGRPASQTAGLVIAASNVAMVQRDPGLKAAFGALDSDLQSMMSPSPMVG